VKRVQQVVEAISRTRVARRLFLLFAVSALLPLAVSAFLSLTQVRDLLLDQGDQRLAGLAKTQGMALFERLLLASDVAVAAAHNPAIETAREALMPRDSLLPRAFDTLYAVRPTGTTVIVPGLPAPTLPEGAQRRLSQGRTAVFLVDTFQSPRVYLAAALGTEAGYVVGELKPEYVYGSPADVPAETDFCMVQDTTQRVLHCTQPMDPAVLKASTPSTESRLPQLSFKRDGREYRVRVWTQFLREGFGTPDWAIVASQPINYQLLGSRQFRQLYIPVIGLALVIAAWLAVRQSRNIVQPVEQLAERARGVAHNASCSR
jgi:hypothetical protein